MKEENFFNPRTIAIIGASDHEEKVGGILMKKALKSKCQIIPINLKHTEVFGIKCYSNMESYGKSVDLAVIAVPKDYVFSALEGCGKTKIKNVIIISAGFSEIGDKESEEKLRIIANKYGIRVIGPNCFGICNPFLNLDLTFSKSAPDKGNIAFISQSGALWSFIADVFSGFSGFVGLGNMMDLDFNDFIDYFSQDKNTKAIILYVEKMKNGREFLKICKKAKERGKIIYAVKAGESEAGSKAAFSHTGSLATDYNIYSGVFKQAGVILCKTLEEAMSLASKENFSSSVKYSLKLPNDIKIITNAGGAGALASDYLSEAGIKVKEVKDILGTAKSGDYYGELEESKKEQTLVILTGQSMTDIEECAKVVSQFKKAIALFLGEKSMIEANKIFIKNKVTFFNNFEDFRGALG